MIGILFMEKSSTACNVWTQDGLSPWGSDCSPPAAWEFVHLHFLCCNLFGTCSGCMGMCPPVWLVSASLSEWLCDSRPKCGSKCWRRVPPSFFAWEGFRHGVLIAHRRLHGNLCIFISCVAICMGMCPPVWFVSASLSEWLCDSRPKCGSECGYCWRRVPPTKFFAWKGFRHGVLITVLMISHLRKDVELAVRRLYDSRPTC